MTTVYIEPYPPRSTGKKLEYYTVKKAGAQKALKRCETQQEAINWAKEHGYTVHVARVRDTKPNPNNPEHWRKV